MPFRLLNLSDEALLRREMRGRWRRRQTFLLLWWCSALFCLACFVIWVRASPSEATLVGQAREVEIRSTAAGFTLFKAFMAAQAFLVGVVAPLVAAPLLCVERERGTLSELLLAGFTPRHIACDKAWSLFSLLVVVQLLPIPPVALCFLLGGVSPWQFVVAQALIAAFGFSGGAGGLSISARRDRVSPAMSDAATGAIPLGAVSAGAVVVALDALTFGVVALVVALTMTVLFWQSALESWDEAARTHEEARRIETFQVVPTPTEAPTPVSADLDVTQLQSRLATLKGYELPEAAMVLRVAAVHPITQREVRSHFHRFDPRHMALFTWRPVDWFFYGFCLVGAILLLAFLPDLFLFWQAGALVAVGMFVIALAQHTAASFVVERQTRMLPALLMCPLTSLELLGGKALSVVLRALAYHAPFLLFVLLWLTLAQPLRGLGFLMLLAAFSAWIVGFGLLISLRCARVEIAFGWTLGVAAFSLVLLAPLLFLALGARSSSVVALGASTATAFVFGILTALSLWASTARLKRLRAGDTLGKSERAAR